MARTLYANLGTASALGAVAYDYERDAALDGSAGSGSLAISNIAKSATATIIFWDDTAAHWSSTWPNADTFSYSINVTASAQISSSCTIGIYRLSSGGGTLVSSATETIDLSVATTVTGSFSTATLSAGAATDVLGCYLLINQSGSHTAGSITISDTSTSLSSTGLSATQPISTTKIKFYNSGSSVNLFGSATPTNSSTGDSALTLGMSFYVTAAADLTKIRFYKHSADSATSRAWGVWNNANELVANGSTSSEGSGGQWIEHTLATPYSLSANARYYVGVLNSEGDYPGDSGFYDSRQVNGILVSPANSTSEISMVFYNGLYTYGASLSRPTNSYLATGYYVDVEVTTSTWEEGTLKYYNGTSWTAKPLKRWSGSSWDYVDGNPA